QAGIAIPLSLALVLAATLTFSPALLRLAGRWAFWPQRPGPAGAAAPASEGWRGLLTGHTLQRAWDRVARLLLRRAGLVWLTCVALVAPAAVVAGLFYDRLSYDVVANLPADAPSVAGTRVRQEHFPAGVLGTTTVLLVNPKFDFGTPEGEAVAARL